MTETAPKKASRFKRHPILTGLGVLFILGVIAWGGKWTKTATTQVASNQTQTTSTSETNPTPVATTFKVWDIVPTGKITYKVSDVKSLQTVGSKYAPRQANWVFKVIWITIKNTSKEPLTVDSSLFKLIDDQGREFSSSTEGRTALSMQWEKDFFLTQAQPGLDTAGKLIFDIPIDAKWLKLQVKGGFWSSDSNEIVLE